MVPFLWRRGAKREPGRAKHQDRGGSVFLWAQPPLLVQGGDFGFLFSCFQCPRVQQKMWDMASLSEKGNLRRFSVRRFHCGENLFHPIDIAMTGVFLEVFAKYIDSLVFFS